MMAHDDVRTVEACISAVETSYLDAANLALRIKLLGSKLVGEDSLAAFEESLALGPPIIRGQYNNDLRRFGHAYAYGDQITRENIKDIIISLQMDLLTPLRMALLDGLTLDYSRLQESSDNGRINTVICLSQLSQRMMTMPPTPAMSASSPSLFPTSATTSLSLPQTAIKSSSASTRSYTANTVNTASSETLPDKDFYISPPMETVHLQSPAESLNPVARTKSPNFSLISPTSRVLTSSKSAEPILPLRNVESDVEVYGSIDDIGGTKDSNRSHALLNRAIGRDGASETGYAREYPRRHGTSDLEATGSQVVYSGDRPPQTGPHSIHREGSVSSSVTSGREGISSASSTPATRSHWWTRGHSSRSVKVDTSLSMQPSNRASLQHTMPSAESSSPSSSTVSGYSSGPRVMSSLSPSLYLPSEANSFAGFCKGAWKLQNGMKKAFSLEQRPITMFNFIMRWRCSKCNFEGPMNHEPLHSPPGHETPASATGSSARGNASPKPPRSFDLRIRIHPATGIRYRWGFLAKSHISYQAAPQSFEGTDGSFACIFCCAENRARAPAFRDVNVFMEHLQAHGLESDSGQGREGGEEGKRRKPPDELLERTKCVVGRLSEKWEDFELNIPPKVAEVAG